MAEVRHASSSKLDAMQADNEEKLEEMRATVDEKLHATLEARLGESFKQVADRLEQVHQGLGEMQTLAQRRRRPEARADQRQDARHLRRSAARGAARAGAHARAVRAATSRPMPGSGAAGRVRDPLPGPRRATARRCGCRSTPSSRARTTSACSMRRSAPIADGVEAAGARAGERACAARRRAIRDKYVRAAAHHRLRDPVPADRGPVRRGAAPARAGRGAAARATA